MSFYTCTPVVLAIALLVGCGSEATTTTSDGVSADVVLYTTFYPTTYFARRLAGEDAKVVCPLPDDEDPIFWKPSEETVLAYQGADLIVVNGAEFEKWVSHASLPEGRIVSTAEPFRDDWVTFEQAVEHTHGPSGPHAHEGIDGHTWLDPLLAKVQAAEIAKALKARLPDAAPAITERLASLDRDLDALDARLKTLTEGYDGHTILASHPAYNYLAKRYGWKILSLDLDPEAMPSVDGLAEIERILTQAPARYILWESAPLESISKRLREGFGLECIEFSPCETTPAAGRDYLSQMNANLDAITPAFRAE